MSQTQNNDMTLDLPTVFLQAATIASGGIMNIYKCQHESLNETALQAT